MTSADSGLDSVWRATRAGLGAALAVVAVAALAGSDTIVLVALAAVALGVAADVYLSVVKYRRTMRREWPRVQALPDDDEW